MQVFSPELYLQPLGVWFNKAFRVVACHSLYVSALKILLGARKRMVNIGISDITFQEWN